MTKKTFIATIIITALLIIQVAGLQVVWVLKANPISWFHPRIDVTIQSPREGAHIALPILINLTVRSNFEITLSNSNSFFYVLDNQNVDSSGIRFTEVQSAGLNGFSMQTNLTNLNAGKHNIIIYYVGMIQNYLR
jgi:hypothetical protein